MKDQIWRENVKGVLDSNYSLSENILKCWNNFHFEDWE